MLNFVSLVVFQDHVRDEYTQNNAEQIQNEQLSLFTMSLGVLKTRASSISFCLMKGVVAMVLGQFISWPSAEVLCFSDIEMTHSPFSEASGLVCVVVPRVELWILCST